MPPLNLPYVALGRPVKPLSLAAALTMVVICVYNLIDRDLPLDSGWGDVIAVASGTAAALLISAWWARSQRMSEIGLLVAASVWFGRGIFIWLVAGPVFNVWFNFAWVVALGGAYLLEKADDSVQGR